MKTNLLKKNKNILRFSVISKINSSKFHLFSTSFKSKNFQTSQNPRFQTTQLLKKSQNPRFLTTQLLRKSQNTVLKQNNVYFGFKIVFWKQIKLTEVSLQRKETRKYHKDYCALADCRFHGYEDETNRFRDLICRTGNG